MSYRTWSNQDLENAVKTSSTKSEVLRKLGLRTNSSGNFQTIDKYIREANLDTSHFKQSTTVRSTKEWNIEDILIENSPYTSTQNLKKKLIKLSLLENKCVNCGIVEWQGKKLSLQLDHINGVRADNRIENLRLLCPNCHSLTPTFCRGANKQFKNKCIDCGGLVSKNGNRCHKCSGMMRYGQKNKIGWPGQNTLEKSIALNGYVSTASKLNVSDNAVRKHMNSYKIIGTCEKCGGEATHRVMKYLSEKGTYCKDCCPLTRLDIKFNEGCISGFLKSGKLSKAQEIRNWLDAQIAKNGCIQ